MDIAVPADHRMKIKESEKKDKYFELVSELRKLWNMRVAVIPLIIGTVFKGLERELEELEIRKRI